MATIGNFGAIATGYAQAASDKVSSVRESMRRKYEGATAGIARAANAAREVQVLRAEKQLEDALMNLPMDIAALTAAVERDTDQDGNKYKTMLGVKLSDAIKSIYDMVYTRLGRKLPPVNPGAMKYWIATLKCSGSPDYLTEAIPDPVLESELPKLCGDTRSNSYAPEGYGMLQAASMPEGWRAKGMPGHRGVQMYASTNSSAAQRAQALRNALGNNPSAAQLAAYRKALANVERYGMTASSVGTSSMGTTGAFPRPGQSGKGRRGKGTRKHRKHTRKAQRKGRKGTRK